MAFEEVINGCHIYAVRMLGIELIDGLLNDNYPVRSATTMLAG